MDVTTYPNTIKSRFCDLDDAPVDHFLPPIIVYSEDTCNDIIEAVKPISEFFNNIEDHARIILHSQQNTVNQLTPDEFAAIQLYTMEFDSGNSLSLMLNQALRSEDRSQLNPWFSFLKLFLTALHKLPTQCTTVWCGIRNIEASSNYDIGKKFAWRGVISCTNSLEILESSHILGRTELRTVFSIECINGKLLPSYSYLESKEQEILLIPGSFFEVIDRLNPSFDLNIVLLKEIVPHNTPPEIMLPKSTDSSSCSESNKQEEFFSVAPTALTTSNRFQVSNQSST